MASFEEYLQLDKLGDGGDLSRDQRLVILGLLHFNKVSARQLVRDFSLGISHATVSRIQKSFDIHGTPSKRARSGRPKFLGENDLKMIETFICQSAKTRRMSYVEIAHGCGLECGEQTIREACQLLGFRKCIPRKKQYLTPAQKALRYAWALDHRHWGYDEWSRVVWTDEVNFSSDHTAYNVTVLRRPGEEYHPDCVQSEFRQGRAGIMTWGAFCGTSKSILKIIPTGVSDLNINPRGQY